ncbi:MAG: capsule assembly Wzi family protein [Terracidiphilus sp.]|nr:capsule assembly Wzi family protein [Terracidiphilus sp.]
MSLSHILEETADRIEDANGEPGENEAEGIYEALIRELRYDTSDSCQTEKGSAQVESVYTVARGISGTPLRDSFHLGSTIVNDYGRPYANGFNNYTGASGYAHAGRFLLYARGEFQGAPSTIGYSSALAEKLAAIDMTTDYYNPTCWMNGTSCTPIPYNQQATIPAGPIASATQGRVMEAYASAQYLNHVFSFGKQDEWLGPAMGSSMAYSNNAENVYAFHINRIEPLDIPLLSRLTGPFRYEFLIGPLKGHLYPKDPWVHVEKVSFRPTENIEFGFERTVIWGGQGHEAITPKSFLRSFFSLTAPTAAGKNSSSDPGARFGAFDFSYRLPFVRNWLTLYADSEVHDDVSPIDAPRRASWRPGLYLARVPGLPKLDVRVEGVTTDPPVLANPGVISNSGIFMYWEVMQRQGYTNNGQLFGDWIGREDKGGQGWITYHLSGNEWIQLGIRNQKAEKDFIPGGTTLNDFNVKVVKRISNDFEINGNFAFEHWKAPIYLPGQQTVTATTIQLTWFPGRKVSF